MPLKRHQLHKLCPLLSGALNPAPHEAESSLSTLFHAIPSPPNGDNIKAAEAVSPQEQSPGPTRLFLSGAFVSGSTTASRLCHRTIKSQQFQLLITSRSFIRCGRTSQNSKESLSRRMGVAQMRSSPKKMKQIWVTKQEA